MSQEDNDPSKANAPNGNAFEQSRQRTTLYRVLAENIVRELREGGHTGHELLGFASAVMQAVTDNAWDDRAAAEATRTEQSVPPIDAEQDPDGRPVLRSRRTPVYWQIRAGSGTAGPAPGARGTIAWPQSTPG